MKNFLFYLSVLALVFLCVGVSGCGKGSNPPATTPATTNVTATFATSGSCVVVWSQPSASVASGQSASSTPTVPAGCDPATLKVNGGSAANGVSYSTGALYSNTTFTATASAIQITLAPTAGVGIQFTPTTLTVAYGQPAVFTVNPNANIVVGASGCTLAGNTCTVASVTSAVPINFTPSAATGKYLPLWFHYTPDTISDTNFATTSVTVEACVLGEVVNNMFVQYLKGELDKSSYALTSVAMTEVIGGQQPNCIGGRFFSKTFPTGITPPSTQRYLHGAGDAVNLTVSAFSASDSTNPLVPINGLNTSLLLGVISHTLPPTVTVTKVAEGVYKASSPLSAPHVVLNMVVPFNGTTSSYCDSGAVLQQLQNLFPSISPRVLVMMAAGYTRGTNSPSASLINETGVTGSGISGTGTEVTLISAPAFPSLQSSYCATASDAMFQWILHEVVHGAPMCFLSNSGLPLCDSKFHWLPSTFHGQLGNNLDLVYQPSTGNYLVALATDSAAYLARHYGDRELCHMELLPCVSSSVSPALFIKDATEAASVKAGDVVPFSHVWSVTIEQELNVYGVPSITGHDNTYPKVWVLVTNEPATLEAMTAFLQKALYHTGTVADPQSSNGIFSVFPTPPFGLATGGRGSASIVP